MNTLLEADLELVTEQPACVAAVFTNAKNGAFEIAEDGRGEALLFERVNSPAVFIELIKTRAQQIRGNHVHRERDETLHVVSGQIELYLLCTHGKHVYMQTLQKGDVVTTLKGTPHALRSIGESECVVLFDKDPHQDRDRVPILKFNPIASHEA